MFEISISLPSDLKREYSYLSGNDGASDPAMFIYREGRFGRSAAVALSSAWMYDEPHKKTDTEMSDTFSAIVGMMCHLGIAPEKQMIQKFLVFVQDGLDDLVKMPPQPEIRRVVGESDMWIDGTKHTRDIIL